MSEIFKIGCASIIYEFYCTSADERSSSLHVNSGHRFNAITQSD